MSFDELIGGVATVTAPTPELKMKKMTEVETPFEPQKTGKLVNWFDQHFYKVDEEYLPSVTTILSAAPKPFLAQWRGEVGNTEADRLMREAADRGSLTHNLFAALVAGKRVIFNKVIDDPNTICCSDQFVQLALYKLVKFFEAVRPRVLKYEEIVFSSVGYAGTMDLLCEIPSGTYKVNGSTPVTIPGGIYVMDIKTGKSVDDTAYWQTAAYAKAWEEMTKQRISGTIILHTQSQNKNGIEGFGTKLRTESEMEVDYSNFMKIFEVWKIAPWPAKPKIVTDLPEILTLTSNKNGG